MPSCNECGDIGASADMRRSPKGGHLCKDKAACKHKRVHARTDWLGMIELAHDVTVHAQAAEEHINREEVMRTIRSLAAMSERYGDLAVELAQAAAREGHTQKAIAQAFDVPASTLRGLKASA